MFPIDSATITLVAIALFAAFVNGGLGYGFSSLTVPVGLLFYSNRVLNPALVLIEAFINLYMLAMNWRGVAMIWKRVLPILVGLLPGITLGSYTLAAIHPDWLKLATYVVLLPLILVQASGFRRPIGREKLIGLPFGAGLGFLYSVTTISGPPLAVLFNNQGLQKTEFRAALALVRVTESLVTAFAYYQLGLFSAESREIAMSIVPAVLIGIPLGAYAIRRMEPETFRRICMSFDTWIVGFGLARVLIGLRIAASLWAYSVLVVAVLVDAWLLYVFFRSRARGSTAPS